MTTKNSFGSVTIVRSLGPLTDVLESFTTWGKTEQQAQPLTKVYAIAGCK